MRDADYASNAYYYLGKSYFYLQQYDLAKKQFEIVIANYPDSPRIADGSIEWLLGEIAKEE
jgi:TolA-binding protein